MHTNYRSRLSCGAVAAKISLLIPRNPRGCEDEMEWISVRDDLTRDELNA